LGDQHHCLTEACRMRMRRYSRVPAQALLPYDVQILSAMLEAVLTCDAAIGHFMPHGACMHGAPSAGAAGAAGRLNDYNLADLGCNNWRTTAIACISILQNHARFLSVLGLLSLPVFRCPFCAVGQ